MSGVWQTKWGARRIRQDPPTLSEAVAAAQGFTDDLDAQALVAAELMGVPVEDAKAELRRQASGRRTIDTVIAPSRERTGVRTVLVERKVTRRVAPEARDKRSGPLRPR